MKRLAWLFTLAAVTLSAGAQDRVSTYTARLRVPDASTGARVSVSNDSDVAAGLRTSPKNDIGVGYRICIFFDNTQNGRSLANGALSTFRSRFPGIPGEVVYANPTFKTMVGYCLDMTEASMLLGRVREVFPKAVVVREEHMPISNLIRSPIADSPADSLFKAASVSGTEY
ncbi:hypothetical protein [uncultured Rikenella sp.]|uniref:hypothetical protein n=1 Tax=uncultured Rikenella sp. TaxID=368003 RepID=UPI00262216EA|nr:hypothetical protein [uncultured Rikenella sp.]